MIPCYNEEENARPIYEAVRDELKKTALHTTMKFCSLIINPRIKPAK